MKKTYLWSTFLWIDPLIGRRSDDKYRLPDVDPYDNPNQGRVTWFKTCHNEFHELTSYHR